MSNVVVIGGGIVGLATAYQILQERPDADLRVLEKESELAAHQSGRNSGVLHSGIYYKPGSLKAVNCRMGKLAMERFCEKHNVPFEICGKVIVATDESQLDALENIYQRGIANQVNCRLIDREELRELEPYASGVRAIHVPEAGMVDYRAVCRRLAQLIEEAGGKIHLNSEVTDVERDERQIILKTRTGEFATGLVVNCGGLHCDRLAKLAGQQPQARIIPFRGEYFTLCKERQHLCRNMIYPVPDAKFPFLGVHFTRMIDGSVECGPNAVFALAREGYSKWSVNLRDLFDSLTYPGFIKLSLRHWKMGFAEWYRSVSKAAFVRALQHLVPEVRSDDLRPVEPGIRAQAVRPNGDLVDDFLILESESVISINNAPSPAATASLQIAQMITDKVVARLDE